MNTKVEKIKKIFTFVLTFIVALLIIYALYANKAKFYNPEIVRYSRITIDENNNIDDVVNAFSDKGTKNIFISGVKKVNNLSRLDNAALYGKTIYIPVIK